MSGWSLAADAGDFEEQILAMVGETMEIAFADTPPQADFPIYWKDGDGINGPRVSKPDTIYFYSSAFGDDCPVFYTTVNRLVDELVKDVKAVIEPEETISEIIYPLRQKLVSAIEKLDQTLLEWEEKRK